MFSLHASQLFSAGAVLPHPVLHIDSGGLLAAVDTDPARGGELATTLAPAFLDIHTHGAIGEDVMTATPEGFSRLGRFYASHGVGWYLPTTVTAPVDTTLAALDRISAALERGPGAGEAEPLGIHLEGPFLSHAKRGVHPTEHLQHPDPALFERFWQAARGRILLLTLAPELPGATDLVRYAAGLGVRVSLGHTNATAAETLPAVEAGASGATHTFNAMRPLDHREPGVLGVTLDDNRLYAELIADTIHVAPPLIRLWFRAKGEDRAVLVTDSMPATGSPDGNYTLGGLPVTVTEGRALLSEDLAAGKYTLAGSTLTMDHAVANLRKHGGSSLAQAVRAATHNPAAMLGRPELAAVAAGQPASVNQFDADGQLCQTWIRGEQIRLS
jgi:N-acetylglucosamine-6-phosphate deacetylase